MAIQTRAFNGAYEITNYTPEINEMDNQYGLFNDSGLFQGEGVTTDSVVFERETQENVLLPQTSRIEGRSTRGRDRKVELFSLPIPYFKHSDYITPQDVQNKRLEGTPESAQTFANVLNKKMEDMRYNAEQTMEYMKVQAIKGLTKSPDGTTIADMLTLFGLDRSNLQIDFELGTSSTNVDEKINQFRRTIARSARIGGAIGQIEVACDPAFFDKLTTHSKVREAYLHYQNSGLQLNRDDLSRFEQWGVVDTFRHKGVMFYSYDAVFNLPDGTTENAFENSEGYTIVNGVRDLYRMNWAPANTLSGANATGQEMYLTSYRDPRDKFYELELEMAPLYYMTRPQLSYRVFSSN